MAKLFSSEKALNATHEAIQIHGGYGFIREYPVERYFRDAKMCEIATGNSMIQRMLIVKELLNGS